MITSQGKAGPRGASGSQCAHKPMCATSCLARNQCVLHSACCTYSFNFGPEWRPGGDDSAQHVPCNRRRPVSGPSTRSQRSTSRTRTHSLSSGETAHEQDCVLLTFLTVLFPFGHVGKILEVEDSDRSLVLTAVPPEAKMSSYKCETFSNQHGNLAIRQTHTLRVSAWFHTWNGSRICIVSHTQYEDVFQSS